MVMSYPRVKIADRSYLTCVVCERPLVKGYKVCYLVSTPGNTPPDPKTKQALCGPHYLEQFAQVYDGAVPGGPIPDNLLLTENVVSLERELSELAPHRLGADLENLLLLDPAVVSRALEAAKNSHFAESVQKAYTRLKSVPDVDNTPPIDMASTNNMESGRPPTVEELEALIARRTQELVDMQARIAERDGARAAAAAIRSKLAVALDCPEEEVEDRINQALDLDDNP